MQRGYDLSQVHGSILALSPSQPLKHKRSISDTPPKSTVNGKKRRKKTTSLINNDLDFENGINSVLGRLNRCLLVDHLTQRTKSFTKDLSLVDSEEKRVPGRYEL